MCYIFILTEVSVGQLYPVPQGKQFAYSRLMVGHSILHLAKCRSNLKLIRINIWRLHLLCRGGLWEIKKVNTKSIEKRVKIGSIYTE